jgi:hypothetical protein
MNAARGMFGVGEGLIRDLENSRSEVRLAMEMNRP